MSLGDRFWSKVRKSEGCWLWTASLNAYGYGQFRLPGDKTGLAHRLAYAELVGPIPEGLDLDHLCRNRACVRPDHLEPVTRGTNVVRGVGFAARNAAKTACALGHPFDERNTSFRRGRRRCRACHAARERARTARRGT